MTLSTVADNSLCVGIINYSTGNILSVVNALNRLDCRHVIVNHPDDLRNCDALIMPGVGHFHTANKTLKATGLSDAIIDQCLSGLPLLGICLGFQLLTTRSDESPDELGLGIFQNQTSELRPVNSVKYKVPHIGWNKIIVGQANPSPLLEGIDVEHAQFYFANKYGIKPMPGNRINQIYYNHEIDWVALGWRDNIHGVQFHPEKSGRYGDMLLKNFLVTV